MSQLNAHRPPPPRKKRKGEVEEERPSFLFPPAYVHISSLHHKLPKGLISLHILFVSMVVKKDYLQPHHISTKKTPKVTNGGRYT
jgi:hypothetical protein